jgi:RecA-family ATPase
MGDQSAIEQLRAGLFPQEWVFNIVEDKAAFTSYRGEATDLSKFNGDCNKGLTPNEVYEKWSQTSRKKKDGRWRTIKKNGLGVLTGPINNGLLAVDIDGEDAESVFAEFMGDDYPAIDNPGTMSWRGKPTNRQLLYRVPEGLQHFFLDLTKAQLDKELAKGKNSEICLRYGGCYSVLPGSVHPDAKPEWGRTRYEWLHQNEGVVARLPKKLLNWLVSNCAVSPKTTLDLPEEIAVQTGPISGHNYHQLSKHFRNVILPELIGAGDVENSDSPVWKLFWNDVWSDERQPLSYEHGSDTRPLTGGCPFHDSSTGKSFAIFPHGKLNENGNREGLFGWWCHAESVGGGAIELLHALRTGDIEAGKPDAQTLENYLIEAAALLGKQYPESFREKISIVDGDVTYDRSKPTLEWARIIEEKFENPAEQALEFAKLANDHKVRFGVDQIIQLLQEDHDFNSAAEPQTPEERQASVKGLKFAIPDVLLTPSTVILHGTHGTGKSQTAMALAKHILEGKPFKVRGAEMPVKTGGVLWCNGDQNPEIFESQLESHGIANHPNFRSWPKFRLKWQRRLYKKIKELQPALVVIDSLSGCMPGVDNNKQEICKPLYDLEVSNGLEFPATVFLIIHHNNKSNGMRGHSGIGDAVTETWGLDKPTEQDCQEDKYGEETEMRRIITIGKSRIGREGDKLVTRMHEDFSMDVEDFTPVERVRQFSNKVPVIDQIHSHIRQMTKRGSSTTREELAQATSSKTTPNAIRTALRRLKTRGLIDCIEGPRPERGGSAPLFWFACTAEGMRMITDLKNSGYPSPGAISRGEREKTSSSNSLKPVGVTDESRCVTPKGEKQETLSTTGKSRCVTPVCHDAKKTGDTPEKDSVDTYSYPQTKTEENRCVTSAEDAPLNPVVPKGLTGDSPQTDTKGDGEQLLDPDDFGDNGGNPWG